MPFALLVIGIVFLTAAIRGKSEVDLLFRTLKDDFTGKNNFFIWGIAIFMIAAVGYIRPLRPVSNGLLGIVLIALLLSNEGFFQSFSEQIGISQDPRKQIWDFASGSLK